MGKGKVDETGKKKTRRVQKFQKAIVGMSLDDIKRKKAEKPQLRQAAKEAAAREAKARQQTKAKAGAKTTAKATQQAAKTAKATPAAGAGASKNVKGKR